MTKETIQAEALRYMTDLVTKYSEGTCWITRNKAINLRALWDIIRENYFGVFNKTKDRFNQDKVFYPLTETLTWENVKNIDVDTKDVNTRALHPDGLKEVIPCRYILKDWMYHNSFGEILNRWLMYFTLDGHLITKTITGIDEEGKKYVETRFVDLRNCFYDPHCEDIHKTPFIERSVQDLDDVKSNFKDKGWINLHKISGRKDIPKLHDEQKNQEGGVPEVELYEYSGKIKKSWVTGKDADDDEWVNGRMWASNLTDVAHMHKIIQTDDISPYEDVAFEDAPNRHVGRGVGEKVLFLQIYLNTLYNVRRMNNLVMMNQLFKFKNGSGITAESISNLVAGGAIGLNDMGDFERVDTSNINFNDSINEENNLVGVANRVTSNQEASSGEKLPASTPATNAIIQNQAVKTSQQLRQERFGLFLSRLFRRQVLPRLIEIYKEKGVIRIEDDKKSSDVKKSIADYYLTKNVEDAKAEGKEVNPIEMLEKIKNELDRREEIFIELKKIDPKNIDIEFYVTDESFDKNTILQNLQQVLVNYKQFAQDPNSQNILREILDVLGLDAESLLPEINSPVQQQMGMQEEQQPAPNQPQEGVMPESQLLGQQTNRVMGQTANV
jgi:hypothetical protein